jgi:hypothetical protein
MAPPGTYIAQLNLSLGGRLLDQGKVYMFDEGDPALDDPEFDNALTVRFLVAQLPDGTWPADMSLQPREVRCCGA